MDLAGRYLVVWLSPEALETFLGVPVPTDESALTTWTVAGQIVGKAGPGLWVRVKRVLMPDGQRHAAPRGAGLLPAVGAGYDGAALRRAAVSSQTTTAMLVAVVRLLVGTRASARRRPYVPVPEKW
jgi:hypothetical protein